MKKEQKFSTYFRNFIFGVEDSLVSTVGLLSGVAIANVDKGTIFLAGIVLIFVEAFSMGAGSYLSEKSVDEYERSIQSDHGSDSVLSGVIMFFSYFVAGFVPLLPYIIFSVQLAFWISIIVSLIILFVLGMWSSRISGERILKGAFRMFIIGGIAIGLGVLVGYIVQFWQ